jgi:mRNA-degrading endonuclease RelE of RelBE toxin-antitoxin system
MYQVIWKDKAEQSLVKIDKTLAQKIFNKVEKYLAKDPISNRMPLTGKYKGYYRYRFSDYRVIMKFKKLS